MSDKRQRVGLSPEEVCAVIARAKTVVDNLRALYGLMPEEFLWDTSRFQKLVLPTAYFSVDSSMEYTYIGRARAKDLWPVMLSLQGGAELQIQGAKGSGKSTVTSSLVGYMLGKLKKRVVYICGARFIACPEDALQQALLVASGDDRVASLREMSELRSWCKAQLQPLLFVVDDWDTFEGHPDAKKSLLNAVSCHHILVKLSSTNSRERRIFRASDKPPPTFDFDGPYTYEELQTWISQSGLPKARLNALEYLTGGMPGLLRDYEEVGGNGRLFREKIEETYTSKLFDRLVRLQTSKSQLASAVQMVTRGVRGIHLVQPVDLTCFYKDWNKFMILSPYLRTRAEYYIMEQQSGLEYTAVQTWAAAVRMDCIARGRNPARAGWNVEGLVIAVMRYQKKMWDGLPFVHFRTYERGHEAALLGMLTIDELMDGVMVAPVAFNEKAVDVVYLKLDVETGTLTIKAVQITIAKWKNKRRKGSLKVWQEQVLPKWLACTLNHQFIYVMPENLEEELETVNEELLSYIGAGYAVADVEGVDDDEKEDSSDPQYRADLSQVISQPVEFKKLGDVHRCLEEFDKFLNLQDEPAKLKKSAVLQCGGMVAENGSFRQCLRWFRTNTQVFYCCPAHEPRA